MFYNKIGKKNFFMEKGSHVSFKTGEFKIRCIKGMIWVTWPWSDDVILGSGDEISLRTDGVLCLKAFAGSIIEIEKRRIIPCVKSIPRLMIVKTFAAVLSCINDGEELSVFGGSVHSITR